jgi:putative membrane protein
LNLLDNFLNKLKEKYILICIFLLVFFMSYLTPYIGDEYVYSFIYPKIVRAENFVDRVENISDVFKSTYFIYLKWSGRVLPNFFQTLFLFIGKLSFSLVNSIIFVKILEFSKDLILKYEKRINFKNSDYILLFSLIWFFIPVFFQDYISLVSSINYSWMLLILVFYLCKIENVTPKKQIFFSFIIGLTNESVVIFINLLLLYRLIIKKSKKINIWSLVSLWIGSAIQIFSPGNFSRKFHPDSLQSTFSLIEKLKLFFSMGQTILIMKVLCFLILLSFYLIKCQNQKKFIPGELIIVSSLTLSIMLLIMPRHEPRAYLIPFYFFILSIFILLKILFLENSYLSVVKVFFVICLFLSLYKVLPHLYIGRNLDEERNQMLKIYKNKNFKEGLFYNNTIELSKVSISYATLDLIFLNPYSYTNVIYANYYNFDKVYGIPRGNKLLIIEMEEVTDFNNVIVAFDGERNNLTRSQEGKEIFMALPEDTKEIEIEGTDFKIGKIRILEFYKGETLNMKGNITKINLEGNKK